jgi:stage II sporulation protein P
VFATNPNLQYIFDIHRDAGKRSDTTMTLNGKAYAQIFFIVGKKNPNWQQNEAFARSIDKMLKEQYPGLSRGILDKSSHMGNGEYNQSLSPQSILMEIGGPYNTLDECYRTADLFVKIVKEMIKKNTKVNSPAY